ncbi:MAG: hypothetical protein K8M05_35130 [Deltaproteobacteria bacterium]|nr:hypothetical protein [Kofleriaceae bacterium]
MSLFCDQSTAASTMWRAGSEAVTQARETAAYLRKGRTPGSIPAADRPTIPAHTVRDEAPRDPRELLCRTCRSRITHEDHRVEVNGAHEHTFVNPGGFVHRIGCFAVATHLGQIGRPETAFSWFPGFSWQIVVCKTCRTHLGWIYRCAGDRFTGLLLDELVSGP